MNTEDKNLTVTEKDWLRNKPVFPQSFKVQGQSNAATYNILNRDASGAVSRVAMGNKGFVLQVQDPVSEAIYAAKFCLPADYTSGRSEQDELRMSTKLQEARELFAIPRQCGEVEAFSGWPGAATSFVCFISDWVEGETLESYISSGANIITPDFVLSVTTEMIRAIRFLKTKGLKHDDLHWGNIFLRRKDPALILNEREKHERSVAIVDLGSLKSIETPTSKSKDDYLCLLDVMCRLHKAASSQRSVAINHPRFLDGYKQQIFKMADEDPGRHFPSEDSLIRAILELSTLCDAPFTEGPTRLASPFDAISAEHLASDTTLLSLFERTLPWFSQVLAPTPIVLSGPRGCGKSMLFRYMAAKTHLGQSPESEGDQKALSYFGVYIGCATHLQNNLVWIPREKGRATKLAHSIVTFFDLVVLRELLKALAAAQLHEASAKRLGLNQAAVDGFIEKVKKLIPHDFESSFIKGGSRLSNFADDIDLQRVNLHRTILHDQEASFHLPASFLGDVTEALQASIPGFSALPIAFLLDDYTDNRIHPEIQSILNRIIFERRSSHFFKISCEKFGFTAEDLDGVRIDSAREYREFDAGRLASQELSPKDARAFLEGLLDKRLVQAQWAGTAKSLIGDSSPYENDTDLARFIRTKRKGRNPFYFGLDHLARLWSGDTATILQVVMEMFIAGGVTKEATEQIPHLKQHEAITTVSKALRERITGHHPYGHEMANILTHFGSAVSEILVNGTPQNNGDPRRLIQIEMTKEKPGHIIELLADINTDASAMARELLRRSVFIELHDSRGKEGVGTQTVRWRIRKIFLPSFGAALERESYYDIKKIEGFISLLTEPKKFSDHMVATYKHAPTEDLFAESTDGR